MEKDHLAALSASNLRILLISEIRQFIHSLEQKLSLENLVEQRDYIRSLLKILSDKENVEFEQLVGRYFPDSI